MSENHNGFFYRLDKSAIATVIGIALLFVSAILFTVILPGKVDPSWVEPACEYQKQMFEEADPNTYISVAVSGKDKIQAVHHLREDHSLLAFSETENTRIITPPGYERYVTRFGDQTLKLTTELLLLREPEKGASDTFDTVLATKKFREELQDKWKGDHPSWKLEGLQVPYFTILEIYDPHKLEAFAASDSDGVMEDWVDENFEILEGTDKQSYHADSGVIYVNNPMEYKVSHFKYGSFEGWEFNPNGEPVKDLTDLTSQDHGFMSRKELIELGEDLVAGDGCWYCHTVQTRTLIQDTVLNGMEDFPAPPSSANEYVYERVTFPGTRRIGPDLSRVGVKRPSRDWHKAHFWSPKTESAGTIMPAFRYYFDDDPRGTPKSHVGVPNYRFEAVYQWLMTKGTRITAPTQAWWLGKDPVHTKEIIEGKR